MQHSGSPIRSPVTLPPSFLACLPVLWSQVLFPGAPSSDARPRWRSLLILLAVPAVLLYPCLSFRLFEPDEGRYAQIAREMLQRGEWVVPYLQGEPYLDKPPLFYWLMMLSYRLFGVADWSARLVPAVAVQGCVLTAYFFGRRWLGDRAAFRGALLLALAPGLVSMGRLLVLDGLLTWWVTLSVFAAFESLRGDRPRWGWWLVSAAACGLGVLTKGPVAVVLLVPPLVAQRWLAGERFGLTRWHLAAFAGIVLAVVLPWHAAVYLQTPVFARHFFWEHNVVRFLAPFDHLEPVWFYVPVVLAGLLPGTLLLPGFVRFLLSGQDGPRRSPELGFVLLAGGWCLLFFTLSGCKLPTYILPAFPPLALALGHYLTVSRWEASRWPAAVAVGAFLCLCVGHYGVVPWYARYRSPVGRIDEVARYCADPDTPVICYPRNCDSVAFYLGRNDLRGFRSRDIEELRQALRERPRTVVLCTHRHSLRGLKEALPPDLRLVEETHFGLGDVPGAPEWLDRKLARLLGETALGLSDAAVVERR